jgi:hypothetical protein
MGCGRRALISMACFWEIELVDAKNVVLWGLSQGCAASLVALLTWDGEPFGAVVGMCGWLPFRKHLEEIASNERAQKVVVIFCCVAKDSGQSNISDKCEDPGNSKTCRYGRVP